MEITETTVGIWYVSFIGADWLATVNGVEPEGFEMEYRFRYYVDDKEFDSEDVKNWYRGTIKNASREEIIENMRKTTKEMAAKYNGEVFQLLMKDGDMETFMEEFLKMPFTHSKEMSREEAEEEGYLDAAH